MRTRLVLILLLPLAVTGCAAAPVAVVSAVSDAPPAADDLAAGAIAVVTSAAPDAQSAVLVQAVRDAVAPRGGEVTVYSEESVLTSVDEALDAGVDLVVGVGPDTAGAFDLLSAANLDRRFLMLGTQLAEPTDNVVAVVWPGADQRAVFADEKLGFDNAAAYAADAVARGFAAFAAGPAADVISLG